MTEREPWWSSGECTYYSISSRSFYFRFNHIWFHCSLLHAFPALPMVEFGSTRDDVCFNTNWINSVFRSTRADLICCSEGIAVRISFNICDYLVSDFHNVRKSVFTVCSKRLVSVREPSLPKHWFDAVLFSQFEQAALRYELSGQLATSCICSR